MMLSAKILILSSAPPENRLIMPKKLALSLEKNFLRIAESIPGIGTNVPKR